MTLAKENSEKIMEAVKTILIAIGEDPNREGLKETPKRVAKFYHDWLEYDGKVEAKAFTEQYNEMVIVKDIPFFSMCEHHMLPFVGKAHISYIPNGKVLGLSKLVRILNKYARRLQIQEKLVAQVADEIMDTVNPKGCLVVIEAEHLCMSMRGVRTPGSTTVTSAIRGCFEKDTIKQEAMRLIK
jgi:GTP cyclohydrolase I